MQKNAMTITVKTKTGAGAWILRNTINPGITYDTNVLLGGGGIYPVIESFEVLVEISDKTGNVYPAQTTAQAGTMTLDLSGTNVGVGKYHERGTLDVAGEIYSNGTLIAPVGASFAWTGPSAKVPAGYLIEDGRAISRTAYAALFAIYGTMYGAGDGNSTFNIRDKRGRVGVAVSTDTEFDTIGKKFGTKTHTLTTAELPPFPGTSTQSYNVPQGTFYGLPTRATIGGGEPHNNIQPSIAEYSIVRAL